MQNLTLKIKVGLLILFNYLLQLTDHAIKSLITIAILFIFASIFTFNLQIQNMDVNTGKIKQAFDIVQVNTFKENLHSYFYEK